MKNERQRLIGYLPEYFYPVQVPGTCTGACASQRAFAKMMGS
jgi:hypothetical protein